jgi:hypothetical protein
MQLDIRLFGLAIGLASLFNLLLPFAFRTRSDSLVAAIQIAQGLVQVKYTIDQWSSSRRHL